MKHLFRKPNIVIDLVLLRPNFERLLEVGEFLVITLPRRDVPILGTGVVLKREDKEE